MKSPRLRNAELKKNRRPTVELPECVLLIITGTTPGVLTETVWALAHEKIPAIPRRIVTITTSTGRETLHRELLTELAGGDSPIWDQLRDLVFARHPSAADRLVLEEPRIIAGTDFKRGTTFALDDIRTPQHQEAAADFLLAEVQNLTKAGDPPLIVSMAGGRKTMGALLYGAMTLQGREEDRLTHVLIPSPYESPLIEPKFYFPEQKPGWHSVPPQKRRFPSSAAKIDLADVPFPRLRYLFGKDHERLPRRFTEIVRIASAELKTLAAVEFMLDEKLWVVRARGTELQLKGREVPFFHFLCERFRLGHPPFEFHGAAEEEFREFLSDWCVNRRVDAAAHRVSEWCKNVNADDFRKLLNGLRNRFRKAGLNAEADRLFPQRGRLGFSPDTARLLACP